MVPRSARSSFGAAMHVADGEHRLAVQVERRGLPLGDFDRKLPTGVSMAAMLALSGAALHRRGALGAPALELFLHRAIEVEAHRHSRRDRGPRA